MIKWALGSALLWAGAPAVADPLVLVAFDERALVVVDAGEIQRSGDDVSIWQITRYAEARPLNAEKIKITKILYNVRCASKTFRRSHIFGISEDGRWVANEPYNDAWTPIPPGSHLTDVHRIACHGASETDAIFADMDLLARTHDDIIRKPAD